MCECILYAWLFAVLTLMLSVVLTSGLIFVMTHFYTLCQLAVSLGLLYSLRLLLIAAVRYFRRCMTPLVPIRKATWSEQSNNRHVEALVSQYEAWLLHTVVGVDSPFRSPADAELLHTYLRGRRTTVDGAGAVGDEEIDVFSRLFDIGAGRREALRATILPDWLVHYAQNMSDDGRFHGLWHAGQLVRNAAHAAAMYNGNLPMPLHNYYGTFQIQTATYNVATSLQEQLCNGRFVNLIMGALLKVERKRLGSGNVRERLLSRLRVFDASRGGEDPDVGAFLERVQYTKYSKVTSSTMTLADLFPQLARYAERVHLREFYRELTQAYHVIGEGDEPCVPRTEYLPTLDWLFKRYFPDLNFVARRRERDRYLKLVREAKLVRNHTMLRLGALTYSTPLEARSLRIAFGESARSLRKDGSIASSPHLDLYIVNFCMAVTLQSDGVQVHKMH